MNSHPKRLRTTSKFVWEKGFSRYCTDESDNEEDARNLHQRRRRRSRRSLVVSKRQQNVSEDDDSEYDKGVETDSSSGESDVTSEALEDRKHHSRRRSQGCLVISEKQHVSDDDDREYDKGTGPNPSSVDTDKIRGTLMERLSDALDSSDSGEDTEQGLISPVVKTTLDVIKQGNALHALGIFKVPVVAMERLQDPPSQARRRKSFISAEVKMCALSSRGLDFVSDYRFCSSKTGSLSTVERCQKKKPAKHGPNSIKQICTVPTSTWDFLSSSEQSGSKADISGPHSCEITRYRRSENNGIASADTSPVELAHEDDLISSSQISLPDVDRQTYKICCFRIYDKEGHPCYFDSTFLRKRAAFLRGNVKAIYDDSDHSKGIACNLIGPVTSWWLTGFNSGDNIVIGMSTDLADYYLMDPDPTYKIFMAQIKRQIDLTKVVFETISNNPRCSYETLVDAVTSHKPSKDEKPFSENELLQHAGFVQEHVLNYDSARDSYENDSAASVPCMQKLVNLSRARLKKPKPELQSLQRYTRPKPSPATCTPIVREVFDMMFSQEMDRDLRQTEQDIQNYKEPCPNGCSGGKDASVFNSIWTRGEKIECGDYVLTECCESSRVGCVTRFFTKDSVLVAHLQWFCFPKETILGEVGNPYELFMIPSCGDVNVDKILQKMTVLQLDFRETWNSSADAAVLENTDTNCYFYSKLYHKDENRFENAPSTTTCEVHGRFCYSCKLKREQQQGNTVEVRKVLHGTNAYVAVRWHKETYRPGDFVLLEPGTFHFPQQKQRNQSGAEQPCNVAAIKNILNCVKSEYLSPSNVMLEVSRYYRPEDTHLGTAYPHLNVVFASDEVYPVPLSAVVRKTKVDFVTSLRTSTIWTLHNKFFCSQSYCATTRAFTDIRHHKLQHSQEAEEQCPEVQRLRTLDVFAGCGGLSLGFEMTGLSDTRWALEQCSAAARAFQLNFPHSTVFIDDCNTFLKDILDGKKTNSKGQRLPQRGDVELLCGGPPCQGFSMLNRFREGQSSRFKNSLVASYLSLCDVLRPRFFVLENVRNFAFVEQHLVLQLTVKCLLRMGYQCTFKILQAGSFCLPQDRKRFFIIAAAPGEILPEFPEPWSCSKHNVPQITVCGQKYTLHVSSKNVPLRTVAIRDAIDDLSSIVPRGVMAQPPKPVSQFQKMMCGDEQAALKDHQPTTLRPLEQARLQNLPKHPGASWKDIPDIAVPLSDGTLTEKLAYHNFGNGVRALCCCSVGAPCDETLCQKNTLRPWNLTHKEERAKYSGTVRSLFDRRAYSRLDWNGHAMTLTTHGTGSSNGCIHPDQDRFLTPRERARIQGFPDRTAFVGSLTEKNIQIGNAVPPPLAAAVAQEIIKCLATSKDQTT